MPLAFTAKSPLALLRGLLMPKSYRAMLGVSRNPYYSKNRDFSNKKWWQFQGLAQCNIKGDFFVYGGSFDKLAGYAQGMRVGYR